MTLAADLAGRQARPQRHRLLHGYPMTPLLRPSGASGWSIERQLDGSLTGPAPEPPVVTIDPGRRLIVGVLPHTQCAPKVEGCGFCTFPHDRYEKRGLRQVVHGVEESVHDIVHQHPVLKGRAVEALYLGGATANLLPKDQLRSLLRTLAGAFDLTSAEITLEGVPALFLSWLPGLMEVLRDGPGQTKRVSMGIQTFDPAWLAKMGRTGFGDRRVMEKVAARARTLGMSSSGDLLLGLPGRPAVEERADLETAIAVGLDQICLYPLVLSADAGVPWANDPALMAALPSVEEGRDRWLAARDQMLAAGFVQSTLTNFERADAAVRFRYEPASFAPDQTDALGIGPLAISTFVDPAARRAVKVLRGRVASARNDPGRLWFPYEAHDLGLLLITRMLAVLRVDRARYRAVLGEDLLDSHREAVEAVVDAGLAVLGDDALVLTPVGTYYADAVAGTFAASRAAAVRALGAGTHTTDLATGRVVTLSMG